MGEGFISDAINVMRGNRLLLKRRKFKDTKNFFISTSGKTELEFKQVSTEELEVIKLKIRKEAQRTAKQELVIYGGCALILFIPIGYLALQLIAFKL